jgi:hypothetical protein
LRAPVLTQNKLLHFKKGLEDTRPDPKSQSTSKKGLETASLDIKSPSHPGNWP